MIVDIAIKTISHLGIEMKAAAFYLKLYYKQEFKIWKSHYFSIIKSYSEILNGYLSFIEHHKFQFYLDRSSQMIFEQDLNFET